MTAFDVLSRHLDPFRPHFLEASAGTGKTFAIEQVVVRLLIEGEAPFRIEEILVVTFTKAAARELKKRIHRNLRGIREELLSGVSRLDYVQRLLEEGNVKQALERIEAALICYDRAAIYTLHGFCFRLLKEFAFEARLPPPLVDPDQQDVTVGVEKWIRHHLKQRETLSSFSPVQIQRVLRKYRYEPSALMSALAQLCCEGKQMGNIPSWKELYESFCLALQKLPQVEAIHFDEDWARLVSCYVKMTGKEVGEQLALFSEILSSKLCSSAQFDRLLEEESILEKMVEDNLKKRARPVEPASLHYPHLLPLLRKQLLPWIKKAQDVSLTFLRLAGQIREQSKKVFEKEALLSPDALLLKVKHALLEPVFRRAVQAKFKAAIIDEFQDTDPIQWEIIEALFLHNLSFPLYLVGDPKQSIYAFRNADVYVYLKAIEKMGTAAKQQLNTNFRSTPKLVEALNLLFSQAGSSWMSLPARAKTLAVPSVQAGSSIPPLGEEAPVHFFVAVGNKGRSRRFPTEALLENTVYPYLATEIASLHRQYALAYHDIAILVKDRFQGQAVVDFLMQAKIPAQMQRGMSLARSEVVVSLRDILEATELFPSSRNVRRALATPLIGWTAEQLKQGDDHPDFLEAKKQFCRLADLLEKEGFGGFFLSFLETRWYEGATSLLETWCRRSEVSFYFDLKKVCELIVQEEQVHAVDYGDYVTQLCSDAHWEDPRLQLSPREEKGAVKVLTMHRSKGLEFDVVFALGVGSRQAAADLMVVRQEGRQVVVPREDASEECQKTKEEMDAEKQRLLYVALTRAKRRLYIPLFLEEEGQQLNDQEASPIELFIAHGLLRASKAGSGSEPQDHKELYSTLREMTPSQALSVLSPLEPVIHVHILQETRHLPLSNIEEKPQVLGPSLPCISWTKEPLFSFTSLAEKAPVGEKISQKQDESYSLHTLPLGAETGVFVHHLLEHIFKRGLHCPLQEQRIADGVTAFVEGTVYAPWKESLITGVLRILTQPLRVQDLEAFSLAQVPPSQLQCEMEFMYPCTGGLMKGFIDLVFEFEGKYYLLDWKTNYLGPSDKDYTLAQRDKALQIHQYDLQASIYAEALRRHVQLFDKRPFSSCFGGVFYVFVRGLEVSFFIPQPYR